MGQFRTARVPIVGFAAVGWVPNADLVRAVFQMLPPVRSPVRTCRPHCCCSD
jgi:hypothetical protein